MVVYRKKRRKVGPSKNDEKVQRAQTAGDQERAAGTTANRTPKKNTARAVAASDSA